MSDHETSDIELSDRGKSFQPMDLQQNLDSNRESKTSAAPISAMELQISKQSVLKTDSQLQSDIVDALHIEKKFLNTNMLSSKNDLREATSTKECYTKTTPIPTAPPANNALSRVVSAHPIKTVDLPEPLMSQKEESYDLAADNIVSGSGTKVASWKDDGVMDAMHRSESHASRISRAVKHFFCCGTLIEAPSEDNISYIRDSGL